MKQYLICWFWILIFVCSSSARGASSAKIFVGPGNGPAQLIYKFNPANESLLILSHLDETESAIQQPLWRGIATSFTAIPVSCSIELCHGGPLVFSGESDSERFILIALANGFTIHIADGSPHIQKLGDSVERYEAFRPDNGDTLVITKGNQAKYLFYLGSHGPNRLMQLINMSKDEALYALSPSAAEVKFESLPKPFDVLNEFGVWFGPNAEFLSGISADSYYQEPHKPFIFEGDEPPQVDPQVEPPMEPTVSMKLIAVPNYPASEPHYLMALSNGWIAVVRESTPLELREGGVEIYDGYTVVRTLRLPRQEQTASPHYADIPEIHLRDLLVAWKNHTGQEVGYNIITGQRESASPTKTGAPHVNLCADTFSESRSGSRH